MEGGISIFPDGFPEPEAGERRASRRECVALIERALCRTLIRDCPLFKIGREASGMTNVNQLVICAGDRAEVGLRSRERR